MKSKNVLQEIETLKVVYENKLVQKEDEKDQEIKIVNDKLSESIDTKNEMSSLVEKLFKNSMMLVTTIALIDQNKSLEPSGLIEAIKKLQALAEECVEKSENNENWKTIALTASQVRKACIPISMSQFKNLSKQKVDIKEVIRDPPILGKVSILCSKCYRDVEPGQLIKAHCGHNFGKDCIKR